MRWLNQVAMPDVRPKKPTASQMPRLLTRTSTEGRSAMRFVVVVQDDDIIVSVADFYAVYFKPTNQPQLILRRRTDTDDHELLARLAGSQRQGARVGWIV
ncbi:MAG: hypothetical protein WB713_03400 [Methyloceanibacter sp.]